MTSCWVRRRWAAARSPGSKRRSWIVSGGVLCGIVAEMAWRAGVRGIRGRVVR